MSEQKHWAAEPTSYRPSEDAPDFIALVYDPTPGGKKNEDGTTSFSMRFPALILSEYVANPEAAAAEIAQKLNQHGELMEALELYMSAVEQMNATMKDGGNVHGAISGLIGAEDVARDIIERARAAAA